MNNIDYLVDNELIVSVIVTTYNRSKLLLETLESILCQTFNSFELIVVDNMSKDDTEELVNGIQDSRIRYFKNPNNGIIAVNRNYGIQQAKGRYIAFCDDDDLWFPDKLNLQVKLLEASPSIALCYTNAMSFVGNKVISNKMVRRVVCKYHFLQLLRGNFIPNSSVLIRRDVFLKLGRLNENETLREDYEMWLRVSNYYSIIGIDESLISYRVHGSNVGSNRASETLRAIRTVKSIIKLYNIPRLIAFPNILFQYFKYFKYKIMI